MKLGRINILIHRGDILYLPFLLNFKINEKVKKNQKRYFEQELALVNSQLSLKDKFRVLSSKKMKKNIKYILIDEELIPNDFTEADILVARSKLGLRNVSAVIRHFKLYDGVGRTIGCGCELCKYKHNEYKSIQHRNKKRRVLRGLVHYNITSLGDLKHPYVEKRKIKELRFRVHSEIKNVFQKEFDLKIKRNRLLEIVILPKDF